MVNCYYRTLLILATAKIAVAAWTEPRVGVPTCTHAGLRLVKNHWAYCQQIISLDYNFKQWIEIWDSVRKYCGPIYHEIGQAAVACWSHFPTYFANCSGTTPITTFWFRFVADNFARIISLKLNLRQWTFIEEEAQIYANINMYMPVYVDIYACISFFVIIDKKGQ